MAKKVEKQTKKNAANKTPEEPEENEPKTQQAQKAESTSNFELLPSSLQAKFEEFNTLYEDINKSIAGNSKGDSFDVSEKQKELLTKIEEAISGVLKTEISSAEDSIRSGQSDINSQIAKLENSYNTVETILQETKAFTAEEIKQTLAVLEAKVDDKKKQLEHHGKLLEQARNVYE